jgi:hypothetical protein
MSPSAGLTAAAAAAEQPSQGPGWGAFVGGVLLGSTVAAGAAYLAVRYASSASSAAADELRRKERRRPGRIQSGTGRDSAPSGKPLARANTDLYYANGVEDELLEVDRVASPSPRQSVLVGAGGSANGWADGGGSAAGRPPRPKSSPRMPVPMLGPPSGRAGETDAAFTDGTPPGLRGRINEVSESEAAALSGSGQRPAHLYAGPANRSNTAAAEYLRNQGFTFPTMLAAGASPGQAQLLQSAPWFVPPLSLDGRAGSATLPPGFVPSLQPSGSMPAGAAGTAALSGSANQVVVGSYPAAITAQAPPATGTITTADAMATEGRIIEDAAMHEQYVRVITPEPAPTEETEEVCYLLRQSLDMRNKWLFRPQVGGRCAAPAWCIGHLQCAGPAAWPAAGLLSPVCASRRGE